jgi:hypothetical protein
LPAGQAFLDVRVIAFRVATVIPVTGLILLGNRRGLLNVNWRYCRYGNHWRIAIISTIPSVKGIIAAIITRAKAKP